MSKSIEVRVQGGYISARVIDYPECPGIKTVFIPDDGNDNYSASYPSIKMEKLEDSPLHALIWNDSENAFHSDEIIFKEPEPKKDIFAERIEKIRARAKRDEEEKQKAEKQKKSKETRIEEGKKKIEERTDRIQSLIKLANECLKENVAFPINTEPYGYGGGVKIPGKIFNFIADEASHHVGFMMDEDSQSIKYLGFYGETSDFFTDGGVSFTVEKDNGKMYGITHYKYVENFLAEFDIFETAFYKWIDGLDDNTETTSSQSSKSQYETFDELNEAWFGETGKSRFDLTEQEEYDYMQDCFSLYEKIGFAKTFHSILGPNHKYSGLKFEVLGRVYDKYIGVPMWNVNLENGDIIRAYPTEICLAEMDSDYEQTSKEEEKHTYETFEELKSAYGLDNPKKTRVDLTEEEERAYVNALFDLYEKYGFEDTFESLDDIARRYNGLKYKILSRVTEDDAKLKYLPMWKIELENGKKFMAKPKEICLADNMPAD